MNASSGWPDHAIWWHVYPLGFVDAPIRDRTDQGVVHRLPQLTSALDHAVEIGLSGLLLGPVFESSTHGYDTRDHGRVDRRLGDQDDLRTLLDAAHARGLRVVFDGVFNHVGREFPLFQQALAEGPESSAARFFRLTWPADWRPGTDPVHDDFEGHGDLVALNHAADEVADLVTGVLRRWLEFGIDGWRLDAAYAVPPEFWQRVLPPVRDEYPEAWFLGEMIHGDYAGYVQASGLDSITQYELWKAIWSSLRDHNFFELAWSLKRHDEFLDTFVPQTFIGNHDVSRIVTQVGEPAAVLALVVLCTVGGIPSVYYGDEYGWGGLKQERFGGDDAIRPRWPTEPRDERELRWLALHQHLVGLRRRHSWLVRARTTDVDLANEQYTYTARDPEGTGELTVRLGLDPAPWAEISGPDGVEFRFDA